MSADTDQPANILWPHPDDNRQSAAVNSVPRGECVSHGPFVTREAADAALNNSLAAVVLRGTPIVLPSGYAMRQLNWAEQPRANDPPTLGQIDPIYQGDTDKSLGRLLRGLFGGTMRSLTLASNAAGAARLDIAIDLPAGITYETIVENLQQLAQQLDAPKQPPVTGRRRLLKLEEDPA